MTDAIRLAATDGIATLTLNRPERHNAFDDRLIAEIGLTLARLADDDTVGVVMLAAAGNSFSAGADLDWMRRMAGYHRAENEADALRLAEMMRALDTLPKPTIALVHGAAYGGGVGLVAACDIAIAAESASFCLSEVRLGLIPAVISPYVLAAIGRRAARRYMLSAERFDAREAHRIGLVHGVVAAPALDAAGVALARTLLDNGKEAMADTKRLIAEVADRPVDAALMALTAHRIAAARARAEGAEGLAAFLEKRAPAWRRGGDDGG